MSQLDFLRAPSRRIDAHASFQLKDSMDLDSTAHAYAFMMNTEMTLCNPASLLSALSANDIGETTRVRASDGNFFLLPGPEQLLSVDLDHGTGRNVFSRKYYYVTVKIQLKYSTFIAGRELRECKPLYVILGSFSIRRFSRTRALSGTYFETYQLVVTP